MKKEEINWTIYKLGLIKKGKEVNFNEIEENMSKEGEELRKLFQENKILEILEIFYDKGYSSYDIPDYIKEELTIEHLKSIIKKILKNGNLFSKILKRKHNEIFRIFTNTLEKSNSEETEEIIELLDIILSKNKTKIKETNDISNIKVLFKAYLKRMVIAIKEQDHKTFYNINKKYFKIIKEYNIEGRLRIIDNLYLYSEEYSKINSLNTEEINFAFWSLIKHSSDNEIQKILEGKEDLYIGSMSFPIEYIDTFETKNFSKNQNKILELIETNLNLISFLVKEKPEEISNLFSKSKNQFFKSKIKEKLLYKSDLRSWELINILKNKKIFDEKDIENYIKEKIVHDSINESLIELMQFLIVEHSYKEEKLINIILNSTNDSSNALKILKKIDELDFLKNNKELIIDYIKENFKEEKIIKKIKHLNNTKLALNDKEHKWRKKLIEKYPINNAFSENPKLFERIFELLDENIKEKNEIYNNNLLEIIELSIISIQYNVDEEGNRTKHNTWNTKTEYFFDEEVFKKAMQVSKEKDIEQKQQLLIEIYKKLEKYKEETNNINDNIDITTFETFSIILNPNILLQKFIANKINDNRWDNMEQKGFHISYNPREQKTEPKKIFPLEDLQFFEDIYPYIEKVKYFSENFDLNNKMITNYYLYKEKSKQEKKQFIQKFEKEEKDKYYRYENNKEMHKMFSWILLNERLPQDEKLYNEIQEISEFNLTEFVKYTKMRKNLINKIDKKTKKELEKLFSTKTEKEFEESFNKYIEKKFNKMNLYKIFGLYSEKIILQILKDKTEDKVSFEKVSNDKYINYKNFELNYSKIIDFKQLNAYFNINALLHKIKAIPKNKEIYLDKLKLFLAIMEKEDNLDFKNFKNFLESNSNNKEEIENIYNEMLYVLEIIHRRTAINYGEIYNLYGKKIFEKNKNFIKQNNFNRIISKKFLKPETMQVISNTDLDIKETPEYIIKSKMFEFLIDLKKDKKLLEKEFKINPESIKEEKSDIELKLEKKEEEFKEELTKYKKNNRDDYWFDERNVKELKEDFILANKNRMERELEELKQKQQNDEEGDLYIYDIEEGKEAIKKLSHKLKIKSIYNELQKLKEDVPEKRTIKKLSEEEIKTALYEFFKNKFKYEVELIKLCLEFNLEPIEKYIFKEDLFLKENEEIKQKYNNLKEQKKNINFGEQYKNIDMLKSLILTLNLKEAKKEDLLEGFEIKEEGFEIKLLTANNMERYHINRTKGMINCASIDDIGENVLWTILEKSDKNGMLQVKNNEEKTIFSSYIKLLDEDKSKPIELVIDNIEGRKEYKYIGAIAYKKFIKEILKEQYKRQKNGEKNLINYITISNQYSKLISQEINNDIKELEEYQTINQEEYSDAKNERILLFDITDFMKKNPNITEEEIDNLKIVGTIKKDIKEEVIIKEEIRNIIKETDSKIKRKNQNICN